MLKRMGWVVSISATVMLIAAFVVPTNFVPGPLRLSVLGLAGTKSAPKIFVRFPKALKKPHRPPFGQKAWSYSTVDASCVLADGTRTNISLRAEGGGGPALRTNGPHLDLTYELQLPPNAQLVKLLKAETVLGFVSGRIFTFQPRDSSDLFQL